MILLTDDPNATKGVVAMLLSASTLSNVALSLAILYNLHLLASWWWKAFWRDYLIKKGIYTPKKRKYKVVEVIDDDEEITTRV